MFLLLHQIICAERGINMGLSLVIIIIITLGLIYGIANWLIFQSVKKDVGLPRGSFTGNYGVLIGAIIKICCWITIVFLVLNYGFLYLLLFLICWLSAGTITRYLERKIYSNYRY